MHSYSSHISASSSTRSTPFQVPKSIQLGLDFAKQAEWVVAQLKADRRRYLPSPHDKCTLCNTSPKKDEKNRHIATKGHVANMCAELNIDPATLQPERVWCKDCGTSFSGGRKDALERHRKASCPMRPESALSSSKAPVSRTSSLPNNHMYSPYTTYSTSSSPVSSASSSPQSFDRNVPLSSNPAYQSSYYCQTPSWERQRQPNFVDPAIEAEFLASLGCPVPNTSAAQSHHGAYSHSATTNYSSPAYYGSHRHSYM